MNSSPHAPLVFESQAHPGRISYITTRARISGLVSSSLQTGGLTGREKTGLALFAIDCAALASFAMFWFWAQARGLAFATTLYSSPPFHVSFADLFLSVMVFNLGCMVAFNALAGGKSIRALYRKRRGSGIPGTGIGRG